MTRRVFRKLAEVVAGIKNEQERERVGREIGHIALSENASFNWSKWATACNLKERN